MKKLFSINVIFLSVFLPAIIISRPTAKKDLKTIVTSWNADASKAQIDFEVGGPFGKVHGSLSGLKSTIQFDENNLAASSFKASVDPKSISTGIGLRNRDLQKEKFFDSDNHPLISFQ